MNNKGGSAGVAKEAPLLVLPLSPTLPSTAASTSSRLSAAAAAAASDATNGASVLQKHNQALWKELETVEKANQGGGGSGDAAAEAAAAVAVAAADLAALRSRIFSQQPPTEDTTPHGAAGRSERVASLREAAVAAEVEFRRRSCEESGLTTSMTPPSRIARSLFPPRPLTPSHPRYVAACVVLRDQGIDLPEFVAWHAALGIKTFYLYDHGSSPPVSAEQAREMLPPATRDETEVHVEPLTDAQIAAHPSKIPQMTAYDTCVASHRAEHEWLAFLDVDEFVVLESSDTSSSASSPSSSSATGAVPSFPLLLSKYEGAAAALALHWSMFGSGGRLSRKPDSELTAEAFEACLPRDNGNNRHIKTVASTRMLDISEPCLGAHHFAYWDFEGAVAAEEEKRTKEEGKKKRRATAERVVPSSLSLPPPPTPLPRSFFFLFVPFIFFRFIIFFPDFYSSNAAFRR